MKFGVREICDVVLKSKTKQRFGNKTFLKNEPVIYFDSGKTSTVEGAATTVYATGGRGNSRLIAWEGERTLTFTMEDALLSPKGFAILSGAGLIDAVADKPLYQHCSTQVIAEADGSVTLLDELGTPIVPVNPTVVPNADIYIMILDSFDEMKFEPCVPKNYDGLATGVITCDTIKKDDTVLVDYYVEKTSGAQQIEITPDKFGGFFYLEASTLFRRTDGKDLPAEFIIPNVKIQSNFTFTLASTGDPSTFTFTMDAFPDYLKFDRTKKVLAAIQIIDESVDAEEAKRTCADHSKPPVTPPENGGEVVTKAAVAPAPKTEVKTGI